MEPQETKEKEILEQSKVVAMVGLSPDKEKASNVVAGYLIAHGYRIIPVNPGYDEILGEKSYKSLSGIPEKIDIVDIFMRSEKVLPIVEEAIKLKPRAIIVADNAIRFADQMRDFLDAVQGDPKCQSVIVRASEEKHDGMIVIHRR